VECSTWMSSGLSNAETLAASSVRAADTDESRIMVVFVMLLYCILSVLWPVTATNVSLYEFDVIAGRFLTTESVRCRVSRSKHSHQPHCHMQMDWSWHMLNIHVNMYCRTYRLGHQRRLEKCSCRQAVDRVSRASCGSPSPSSTDFLVFFSV